MVTIQDLVALERALEAGDSLIGILREWKNNPQIGDHSLGNYIVERYDMPGPTLRASHHDATFEALTQTIFTHVFGRSLPEDFHQRLQGGE